MGMNWDGESIAIEGLWLASIKRHSAAACLANHCDTCCVSTHYEPSPAPRFPGHHQGKPERQSLKMQRYKLAVKGHLEYSVKGAVPGYLRIGRNQIPGCSTVLTGKENPVLLGSQLLGWHLGKESTVLTSSASCQLCDLREYLSSHFVHV